LPILSLELMERVMSLGRQARIRRECAVVAGPCIWCAVMIWGVRMMRGFLGACCLGAVLTCRVQAAVVLYEQPATTEPVSLSGRPGAGQFEPCMDATMTGVEWCRMYASEAGTQGPAAWPVDFGIRFFTENEGLAGTLISDQTLLAIVRNSRFTVTQAGSFLGGMIDRPHTDLPAGAFVGLHRTTGSSIVNADQDTLGLWRLSSHSPPRTGGAKPWRNTDGGTRTLPGANSDQLALTLDGEPVTIAVPGVFVLGGIAVALLGWLRRRGGSAGRVSD
jgi:hypothetical protein